MGSGIVGKVLLSAVLVGVGMGVSSPAEASIWDWLSNLFGQKPVQVPEPATLALFATGAAAVAMMRRRGKKD